jgi:hypothetical protein
VFSPTERPPVELLPDLDTLTDAQKDELIAELEAQERAVSDLRHRYFGVIDDLKAAYDERLRTRLAGGGDVPVPAEAPTDHIFRGRGELPTRDLDAVPSADALDDDALRALIWELEAEEDDVSFARRRLQGHLDIARSSRRGEPLDVDRLAEILASGRPSGDAAA